MVFEKTVKKSKRKWKIIGEMVFEINVVLPSQISNLRYFFPLLRGPSQAKISKRSRRPPLCSLLIVIALAVEGLRGFVHRDHDHSTERTHTFLVESNSAIVIFESNLCKFLL